MSRTMPRKAETIVPAIYQIEVTLNGSKPPIWRRIQVPADITLAELYTILQVVMGWQDYHLHAFRFGDSWEHVLEVEKSLPPEPDAHYPRCLAGKRACPPEDVGGIWGYADFLAAVQPGWCYQLLLSY